ncbi:hypothetical protein DQ384_27250 [Sphaerisporangium album]|uniref:Uncharacterized protein n=1 Tax=Sphaerisporangium album TaxID=509200 RepID=A0A367FBB4_9ACTN|nr:hypothetical protein [Sphaerisporangium album]RCG26985.1 hypothetical protein DQ384_27250 [Sphaerisporangium album]
MRDILAVIRRGVSVVLVVLLGSLGLLVLPGCGGGEVVGPERIADLRAQGVAPDLLFVVDLPGYRLVERTMSVYGEEGLQAYYAAPGRQVWFGVERGDFSDALCPERPVHDAEWIGTPVGCDADEAGWYRVSGDRHEYAVAGEGHVVRLSGRVADVDRAALAEAMTEIRRIGPAHPGAPGGAAGTSGMGGASGTGGLGGPGVSSGRRGRARSPGARSRRGPSPGRRRRGGGGRG